MKDHIELGPVPYEEDCQQVGTPTYDATEARNECRRFIELIRTRLGHEPEGARLKITSNPHDFGTYFEVVVEFDDFFEEAVNYAFHVESNIPARW